jgi:hypothetical protein
MFALAIIKLVKKLINSIVERTISSQVIRSGILVAANYRAIYRAMNQKININSN